jgi:hypothetical protein
MRGRQWMLLAGLFVLTLPAVTTRIYSSDEIQYFSYLRSLWFDRDLSFENEYQYFYARGTARSEGFHETFLERQTETGRRINFATMGCALLWAPFYAVGDAVARVTGAPADGFSRPYIAAVAYGSAAYGFLALVLAALSARQLGLSPLAAAAIVPARSRSTRPNPAPLASAHSTASSAGPATKNASCSRTIVISAPAAPSASPPRIVHVSRTWSQT